MPQSTARDGSRDATGDAVARPVIGGYLASTWIPALDGVDAKLRSGGRVADIGCGYGYPSIVIAEAYPHATVHGYDYHDAAIAKASDAAAARGLHDRVRFEVADASRFAGGDYDLVLFVDSLHDLGDPVGALRYARQALAPGGTVLLIEPAGGDRLEDNFHPFGILSYTASVLACTPNSLAQQGDPLGTLAGEARLREVAERAGFSRVRRLDVEAPMNLLLELRP
jgi:SAM-dependent methyltransferase